MSKPVEMPRKNQRNSVLHLPFLEELNDKQLEAVLHEDNPLLILAGAGSGKTGVITVKISWLVLCKGVDPHSILAVTFTNKAAKEMRNRLSAMASEAAGAMIRTFHSFCAWVLRLYGNQVGLDSSFSIYDDEDAALLLKSIFPKLTRNEVKHFSRLISQAKDYALGPNDDLSSVADEAEFVKIYQAYQKRLDEIGNVDFGGLIMKVIELLQSDCEAANRIRYRFSVILVDEYQDSNIAQYKLLQNLYDKGTYFCVVGDDDQSIYRFRGAEVQNILSFQNEFKDSQVIRLEQNYRSTGNILSAASAVVANNEGRLGKELWTDKGRGEPIRIYHLNDQDEEAALVAKLLDKDHLSGYAILYRTNAQSIHFESALSRFGIAYRVVGSLRFYAREEIKDAISFLALLINPKDEIAFSRIINKPARGIGDVSKRKIVELSLEGDGNLLRGAKEFGSRGKSKAAKGASSFVEFYAKADDLLNQTQLASLIKHFLDESGLTEYYRNMDLSSNTQKVNNLNELVNLAANYSAGKEGLIEFLEQVELDSAFSLSHQRNEDEEAVVLMTMHNTKGLEFDHVIVTGMEEGLFPSIKSSAADEIEEERRICYVAMTRARETLTMTSCRNRRIWGRSQYFSPSRFIKEIPKEFVEIMSEQTIDDERETLWKRGQAVYHDDYGEGVIIKNWSNGTQIMVIVRFSTGFTGQFFTQYSGLEIISTL